MGDLLIRNFPDGLKRKLSESALRRRRNLSEEAVIQIQKAYSIPDKKMPMAGDHLAGLVVTAHFEESEIQAIDSLRKQPDRDPPLFD